MKYPNIEHVLFIASRVNDGHAMVRDSGLLQASIYRPATNVFGVEAYPTVWEKAAALLHSLSRNHPFIDGNKRTALLTCLLLLEMNGIIPGVPDTDELEALVVDVATGKLEDIPEIAKQLKALL